jgi:RES domain-containing protein
MRFWRISNFADLSGEGGKRNAGRWNLADNPMVYLADHPSTAMLETLVHFRTVNLPATFQLLAIDSPDAVGIAEPTLPAGWEEEQATTQIIGTRFLEDGAHALLRVPSVVMPQAFNFLLNPAHPDAALFRIAEKWRYPFDSRLLS